MPPRELRPVSASAGPGRTAVGFFFMVEGRGTGGAGFTGLAGLTGLTIVLGGRGTGGCSHAVLTLLCAVAIRAFNNGSALDALIVLVRTFFGAGGGFSLRTSTFVVGSKYFGTFSGTRFDAGFHTGSDFFTSVTFVAGSKARIGFVFFAAPEGCHGGSRWGLGGEGGAFEPINFGRLIVPLGRQTGDVREKVPNECRSGFGALSRRTRDRDRGVANRLGGVIG